MNKCPCCRHRLQVTFDFIFYHEHEFADCEHCDCLFVKNIDTGEWIESSSINQLAETGVSTGAGNIRRGESCFIRGLASRVD